MKNHVFVAFFAISVMALAADNAYAQSSGTPDSAATGTAPDNSRSNKAGGPH